LVLPCLLVLVYSFVERGAYGGIDWTFTWDNYARAFDPLYLGILLKSAKIAALATLFAVLIGYPAAYAIARAPRHRQPVYLFLVMLPFWSNYLIRTYAWIVLLNREGLLNKLAATLGYSGEPISLLYTESSVVLGLVYNYIPFVILAIYSSLSRINGELWEASRDLGASGWMTFRRIILPLSVPGIAAGSVFVFVLSIGNFITADLLGGKQVQMVGNLIYSQFLTARDWPFGSALSFILIAIMLLLLFVQALLARRAAEGKA
ncbi:MAG: ABC transporter permease, partial [Pseudomonas sp.]|uniref:ABC transporter permease n=1 Tax=Pseudomonas sp. TaxID=306 RepID=UPI0030EFEEEE